MVVRGGESTSPKEVPGPPSSLAQAIMVLPGAFSEEGYVGKSSDLGSEFGEHLSNMSHSKSSALASVDGSP